MVEAVQQVETTHTDLEAERGHEVAVSYVQDQTAEGSLVVALSVIWTKKQTNKQILTVRSLKARKGAESLESNFLSKH